MATNNLMLGPMQSGKTTETVNGVLSKQKTDNIVAFINYSTNTSMRATNKKIMKHNVTLYYGLEGLRAFNSLWRIKQYNPDTKYVLSLTTHDKSLEVLKQIITSFGKIDQTAKFDIYTDESDTMAIGHTKKGKKIIHKTRILENIRQLPNIRIFGHITASPDSEVFSNIDFDNVEFCTPGEGYVSLEEINFNHSYLTNKDIASLYTIDPTKKMIEWIQRDEDGVDLIQIVKNKKDHAQIVQNLKQYSKDACIGLSNSNKQSHKYWNEKGWPELSTAESFEVEKLYILARRRGVKRCFIVAYFESDRTNTFREKNGTFNNLRSLFHVSPSALASVIRQRAGRLCGYPIGHIPTMYLSKETYDQIVGAIDLDKKLMNMTVEQLKSTEKREEYLRNAGHIPMQKIKYTNGKTSKSSFQYYKSKESIGQLLSEKGTGIIPIDIPMDDLNLRKNKILREYFKDNHDFKRVLHMKEEKTSQMLRPNNNDIEENYRDFGVRFTGRKYTYILQSWDVFPMAKEHSIHRFDGGFDVWSTSEGVVKKWEQ